MSTSPLRTDRLSIEPLGREDRDAFVRYRQDPDVARWQSWTPAYSTADADALIASQPATALPPDDGWVQLAVHDVASGELAGDVAVHTLRDRRTRTRSA